MTGGLTIILLSFSRAYSHLAQKIADDLRNAHLAVRFDAWEGGGGLPARQLVANSLDDIQCLLPILTPSEVAPTWIGDEWVGSMYQGAIERGLSVLPVKAIADGAEIPGIFNGRSFANLSGSDYEFELRRLLRAIREITQDFNVGLPDQPRQTESGEPLLPLVMVVGEKVAASLALDQVHGTFFREMLPMMYDGLFYARGVYFPVLEVVVSRDLPPTNVRILLHGVPETDVEVQLDRLLVSEDASQLAVLGIFGLPCFNPINGNPCAWISAEQLPVIANSDELAVWTPAEYLILVLNAVLQRKAADFVGIEQTQLLLDGAALAYPHLVAETVPDTISLFTLTDVLRRLVDEEVNIRNLRRILMALVEWGRFSEDPLVLAEYARTGLRRQLTHQYSRGTNQVFVFLLDPVIEYKIREAFKHSPTGSYVDLAADELNRLLVAVQTPMAVFPAGVQMPVILTEMDIRAAIRRLVASSLPRLHVLCFRDLRPDADIQPVGRISLDGFEPRHGLSVGGVPIWKDG